MGERDKLIERASRFLEPDEQVQAIFGARAKNHGIWTWIPFNPFSRRFNYRTVVATDRRYLILDSGSGPGRARKVLRELPRAVRMGTPESGKKWFTVKALGEGLDRPRVHKRYYSELQAADAAAHDAPPAPK